MWFTVVLLLGLGLVVSKSGTFDEVYDGLVRGQSPRDCKKARLLIYHQFGNRFEGTGSVLKSLLMGLAEARHTNRVLVWGREIPPLFQRGNHSACYDAKQGGLYNCHFEPLSSCSLSDVSQAEMNQLWKNGYDDTVRVTLQQHRRGLAAYVPIKSQRSLPFIQHAWPAALAAYVFRLNRHQAARVKGLLAEMPQPLHCAHVRHGDVKKLASTYKNRDWYPFEDYFSRLHQLQTKEHPATVFVGSDSMDLDKALADARKAWPLSAAVTAGAEQQPKSPPLIVSLERFRSEWGSHIEASAGGCVGQECSAPPEAVLEFFRKYGEPGPSTASGDLRGSDARGSSSSSSSSSRSRSPQFWSVKVPAGGAVVVEPAGRDMVLNLRQAVFTASPSQTPCYPLCSPGALYAKTVGASGLEVETLLCILGSPPNQHQCQLSLVFGNQNNVTFLAYGTTGSEFHLSGFLQRLPYLSAHESHLAGESERGESGAPLGGFGKEDPASKGRLMLKAEDLSKRVETVVSDAVEDLALLAHCSAFVATGTSHFSSTAMLLAWASAFRAASTNVNATATLANPVDMSMYVMLDHTPIVQGVLEQSWLFSAIKPQQIPAPAVEAGSKGKGKGKGKGKVAERFAHLEMLFRDTPHQPSLPVHLRLDPDNVGLPLIPLAVFDSTADKWSSGDHMCREMLEAHHGHASIEKVANYAADLSDWCVGKALACWQMALDKLEVEKDELVARAVDVADLRQVLDENMATVRNKHFKAYATAF